MKFVVGGNRPGEARRTTRAYPQAHSARERRYRVFLSARFSKLRRETSQRAINLSHGGLFIRGTHDGVAIDDTTQVELDLPGQSTVRVDARVAHIVGIDEALQHGHRVGIGLQAVGLKDKTASLIAEYLQSLNRRSRYTVIASDRELCEAIVQSGYRASLISDIAQLEGLCNRPDVVAIALPRAQQRRAAGYLAPIGYDRRLFGIDWVEEYDGLLAHLDRFATSSDEAQ